MLAGGEPVLQRYGVSDDDAFAVGLTCGGIIDLFVERVDAATFPELPDVAAADRARTSRSRSRPSSTARGAARRAPGGLAGPGRPARSAGDRLDDAVTDDGRGLLAARRTGPLHYRPGRRARGRTS